MTEQTDPVAEIMRLAAKWASASAAEQNEAIACGWGSHQHEDAGEKTYRCEVALESALRKLVEAWQTDRGLAQAMAQVAGKNRERAERAEEGVVKATALIQARDNRIARAEAEAAALRKALDELLVAEKLDDYEPRLIAAREQAKAALAAKGNT